MKRFFSFVVCGLLFVACNSGPDVTTSNDVSYLSFSKTATHPHDTASFTEGLTFYKGQLYEGTGEKGKSKLRQVDLTTGKPVREVALDPKFFGEGITILNDTIYQLTWQEHVVHVYDMNFKKIREFKLNTEGWGLTHDGKNLILSDGSSNLYFYEPSTFRLLRTQGVMENGGNVVNINELEYINGFIYANQWQYNYIIKIDPSSGQVVGKMDLTPIADEIKAKAPYAHEINGIAYNPDTKKVYITGKNWPELYEIQFAF
jgi:glutamine cyclotransferase